MTTRFVDLSNLPQDIQRDIVSHLSPGETIDLIVSPVYFGSEKSNGVGFAVLTNLRVLAINKISGLQRKLLGGETICIYLHISKIVSIYNDGGGTTFKGTNFDMKIDGPHPEMKQFVQTIIDRQNQPQSVPSKADRLRELQQLHNDGLISDVEFQEQRQRILNSV